MHFVQSVYRNLKLLPSSIFVIGLVSFFTDISSEMIYPLLPIFLTQVLLATPASLGLIEGIAEATSSIFKLVSGYYTDKFKNRKVFILAGYSISSFFRPLIAIAQVWPTVLLFRFIDRLGKGIRTSPRDALIADQVPLDLRGQAYGVHRAMDHAGAFVGPLIASLLMSFFGFELRQVFLSAFVPGLIAVILIYFAINEKDKNSATGIQQIPELDSELDLSANTEDVSSLNERNQPQSSPGVSLKLFYLLIFMFTLANCADSFLVLRLNEVGIPVIWIPTIWSALNLIKMSSNLIGGYFSDRLSPISMLAFGWIYFAVTYFAIGYFENHWLVVFSFLIYGIHFGFVEPAERVIIAQFAKQNERGTLFGYFHMISGLGLLPASLIFGWLWQQFNSQTSFLFSTVLALAAGIGLLWFGYLYPKNKQQKI